MSACIGHLGEYSNHEYDGEGFCFNCGDRDMVSKSRVEAMLRLLIDSGDLTPMGQRQILKLWEAGQ